MKSINCSKIAFLLSSFLLISCSTTNSQNSYKDLNFIDLVRNKEDSIHNQRMYTLNSKISNREKDIRFYQKKVRFSKQAINNLKIEISHYNSMINNVTNKINNINQLNSALNQFEQQIRNIEMEFNRVKKISSGLEKINKSDFLDLKRKGYFKEISNWSEYISIVTDAVETKKEIDKYIKNSKKGIAYVKANKQRILKKIVKKGAVKVIGHFIPILNIAFLFDDLKDIYDYFIA
jgi:hypothetical protein